MSQKHFELISKFFHFEDISTKDTFSGPKKLFKLHTLVNHLNVKFQNDYVPHQNSAIDESITLWEGRLSFKIYIPLGPVNLV